MEWKQKADRIFTLSEDEKVISEVCFTRKGDTIHVTHVYVDESYRGQGIANEAMLAVMDYLKSNRLKLTASCPYAISWIEKNGHKYKQFIDEH